MRFRVACLLIALLPGLPFAAGEEPEAYAFLLNDRPVDPPVFSMHGDPATIRPGDLVEVQGYLLPVGPPATYRYRIDFKDVTTPLFRIGPDGAETLVAVTVKRSGQKLTGGLLELSAEDRARLAGVRLAVWDDRLPPALADLDPARVAITLDEGVGGKGPGLGLPAALRHVEFSRPSAAYLARALEGLPQLRFLKVDAYGRDLDAEALAGLSRLVHLDLVASSLANRDRIAGLSALRDLTILLYSGAPDLAAVRRLPELRRLDLSRNQVGDLSPLGGHGKLERIVANLAPVTTLPSEPLPSLVRLDVMATRLTDDAIATFAKAHPDCRIRRRLDGTLHRALEGVTRIRVRSGGTCHRDVESEKTLLTVTDPKEIAAVVGGIRIQGPAPSCQCCGDPTFEFWRDGRLVVSLGFHHGRTMRWPGGWPCDGDLSEEGAAFLAELLARHGVEVR